MVLFCFFLGVFTTALYGIYEVIAQRQTIRQLKRNLEILAQELKSAGARAGEAAAAPPGSKAGSPRRMMARAPHLSRDRGTH